MVTKQDMIRVLFSLLVTRKLPWFALVEVDFNYGSPSEGTV